MARLDVRTVVSAGLWGGMAEVVWVALYGGATGLDVAQVARQITASVLPSAADAWFAAMLGIGIHFVLSIGLALAFASLVWQPLAGRVGSGAGAIAGVAALCVVWAVNFFIVLPWVNPAFATLMPYSVTFASKALFGVAMVLRLGALRGVAPADGDARAARMAG